LCRPAHLFICYKSGRNGEKMTEWQATISDRHLKN
jgi:hypothetical protein